MAYRRQKLDFSEGESGGWIPGLGDNKPRPREYHFMVWLFANGFGTRAEQRCNWFLALTLGEKHVWKKNARWRLNKDVNYFSNFYRFYKSKI